jgi:CheY-like chemotaxis protein
MFISYESFAREVAEAYDHLYDMAYLRHHPLCNLYLRKGNAEKAAWRLHLALIDMIESLNPTAQAPADSPSRRRYQLLYQHYVEGDSAQAVADLLMISRRHFYREKERAIADISAVWWRQVTERLGLDASVHRIELEGADRLHLVREEADRSARTTPSTQLSATIAHAQSLSQALLSQYQVTSRSVLGEDLPLIQINAQVLLHVLLGIIEYGARQPGVTELRFEASTEDVRSIQLLVHLHTADGNPTPPDSTQLVVLRELASTQQISLSWSQTAASCYFRLMVPALPLTTVLVVDDNPDIHELFMRYLMGHGYRVIVARDADEACRLAIETKPDAITIDLMMPGQDGLTLLQALRAQPETEDTPIAVCSILEERQLALSLGADCVLVKPISQQDLLEALTCIVPRPDAL